MRRIIILAAAFFVAGCNEKSAATSESMTLSCQSGQSAALLKVDPANKSLDFQFQSIEGNLLMKFAGLVKDGRDGQIITDGNVTGRDGNTPTGPDFDKAISMTNAFHDQMKRETLKQHFSMSDDLIQAEGLSSLGKPFDFKLSIDRTLGEMTMGRFKLKCTQERRKF